MPKLTVITTVYNTEDYIKESLDSVINQTFTDFELIIVNDGSTDNTRKELLKFADMPNVRLLENEFNEGIFVSRNRALLEAQGEYIAIHDADDISLPHRFQKQVNFLDENSIIGFIGSYAFKIGPSGHLLGYMIYPPTTTTEGFAAIINNKLNPIIDPSCMYRRDVVLSHGGYKPLCRHSMDFDLWCRLLLDDVQMSNIPETLIKYRIHDKNISTTHHDEMREVTEEIWAGFKQRSIEPATLRPDYYKQESFTEYRKEQKYGF